MPLALRPSCCRRLQRQRHIEVGRVAGRRWRCRGTARSPAASGRDCRRSARPARRWSARRCRWRSARSGCCRARRRSGRRRRSVAVPSGPDWPAWTVVSKIGVVFAAPIAKVGSTCARAARRPAPTVSEVTWWPSALVMSTVARRAGGGRDRRWSGRAGPASSVTRAGGRAGLDVEAVGARAEQDVAGDRRQRAGAGQRLAARRSALVLMV